MRHSHLLGGDLKIHRLGFGAMRITGEGIWGPPRDKPQALAVLRRAVELGVNLIDTADSYGPAVSEELIAEALYPYPDGLVIATKGGLVRPGPGDWRRNGRPAHLVAACEASLRRLRVARIDLYQLHAADPQVPYADSIGALAQLQAAGKIRHIGVSNVSLQQLKEARALVNVVSVQNRYNLEDRASEDVLQACERDQLAFLPWFPLAAGPLAREHGALGRIAQRHHATMAQVAIAWLLAHSPVIVPIPGTASLAHLEENIAAAALSLSRNDLAELAP
jgi:pyridoxine 4-dehydrogenase